MSKVVNTSFQGLMDSFKKSKYPLAPVYEAITNALEAIFQKEYKNSEKPEITITFDFAGLLEGQPLNYISVKDNGIGFNTANFNRFETLLDKSKGYNNRGSGRIQYFHRFGRINIESYYEESGKYYKRSFSCNTGQFTYDRKNETDEEKHSSGTIVTMLCGDALGNDKEYYDSLKITDIISDLKRHFLLRFYLDVEEGKGKAPIINIIFSKNPEKQEINTVKPEDMPKPSSKGEVKVSYLKLKDPKSKDIEWQPIADKDETVKWAHFKLADNDLSHNAVYLCSKGISVEPISYDAIKKNEAISGHHYLTVFYGDVLNKDTNVNDAVDSFCFPDKKYVEECIKEGDLYLPNQEFLFYDTIKEEVNEVIPTIYKDIINLKQTQDAAIEEIARRHGISLEIALKAKINLSDNEQKITEKLYKAQAKYLSEENQKIRKIFNELNKLNPTSENYQKELEDKSKELLGMIPRQNQEELGRYVIRREMVAEVLKKILAQELDYQKEKAGEGKKKDKEGLIHDLIFKRKRKNSDPLNDLWILSEEYVHFDGCSDLPLNKIEYAKDKKLLKNISQEQFTKYGLKDLRRPDIFLYAEEGKCVIIELKQPLEDLSNHLNQMTKYCNLIANFSEIKIEKFYCYLIGENISPNDLPGDYDSTVSGDWIKTNLPIRSFEEGKEDVRIASSQIEVIKLSSIHARANRRNKSFADKLGLRELLKETI